MFRTLISPNQFVSYLGGGALSKGVSVKISFFRSKRLTFILRRRGSLKNRISKLREKKFRLLGDLLAPKTGQNGCFSAISSARTKNLFDSLFSIWQKYYESSKTEYSDSTSYINQLSLFFIKKTPKMSEKTPKIGPPTPLTPQNPFFW